MRRLLLLIIFPLSFCAQCDAFAQSEQGDYDYYEYEARLRRERYETAIARERTERARLESQRRGYVYQERLQDIHARRAEQQRERDMRDSDISSVNQVVSTVGNVVGRVRGGW